MRWVHTIIVALFVAIMIVFVVENREVVTMSVSRVQHPRAPRVGRRGVLCAGRDHGRKPARALAPLNGRRTPGTGLEHDPEKWIPLFGKIMLHQEPS